MPGSRNPGARSTVIAAAAGAAGAYFLDPDNGKRRRHVARDRALAAIRRPVKRAVRQTRQRASYAGGVLKGAAHEVGTHDGARDPGRLNDVALARKVESEIFRDRWAPKGQVNVNVEDGVVFLRGQLDTRDEIEQLIARTASVDGVGEIRSLLHLPGEKPPSKESEGSIAATGDGGRSKQGGGR